MRSHDSKNEAVRVSNDGSNSFDMAIYWNQVFNSALALCPPSEFLSVIKYNLWFHYEQITKLAQLEYKGFTEELSSFLSSFPFFTEIDDLYSVKQRPGIYLLVLDDYACCYFGQSKDIKQRIMQHWRKTNFSTTGIDMFKALDTTRIYVLCTEKDVTQSLIDRVEYHVIHAIDRRYLLNCYGGGNSLELIHLDSPGLGYGSDPV